MANYKKISDSRVQFVLTIEKSDLDKAQALVIKEARKTFTTKGFRKGHAPKELVMSNLGHKRIAFESLNKAIDQSYKEFIIKEHLAVISAPEAEFPKKQDLPMTVTFKVEVFPSVTLGSYEKLKIKKPEVKIEEKEVDEVLKTICAQMQKGDSVKRKAKKEDLVEVDFAGKGKGGEVLPNTEGKNHKFRLGMGQFLEDLEKAFVGMLPGEEKTGVKVKFPSNYGSKDFAGKTVPFDIKLHGVFEINPQNLTEEEIEQVSGKKQSFEDLRAQIKTTVKLNKEQEKHKKSMNEYNEKLVKVVEVDLPKSWIEKEVQIRFNQFAQNPQYKADPDAFWKRMGKKEDDLKKEFAKDSEANLKVFLGLSEIVKQEKIELNKDEMKDLMMQVEASSKDGNHGEEVQKMVLNSKIDKYLRSLMN
ncbi:trigger factor [Candidatus Gracilibacteria bacterium]|nr:trigger factor [Candidatus Gracilibacteria bacterium]